MPLTDTACKNAKPASKPYKKADGGGLFLLIHPNGGKYWRLKYRYQRREKLLGLGVYPDVSLSAARLARDEARQKLADGIDPSAARQEDKLLALLNPHNTFEAIAREWHQNNLSRWSDGYGEAVMTRLESDIFPSIGKLPISSITPPQLLVSLQAIQRRGAIEVAHRLMQVCGQVFRFAVATGRAERNPTPDLRGALIPVRHSHYAALDGKELPEFIRNLDGDKAQLAPSTRNALRLLMLTFVRTSELIGARWSEIDFETKQWIIPAERMKMRKPHIVPLSRQAITLLQEQKEIAHTSALVFPNRIHPRKSMSNNTILKALDLMGYKGRMTGHGFRALAMSTIKERLDYRHEVIDRQLAHAPKSKVDKAYDRAQFLDERKRMMQDWANYLDAAASEGKVLVGKFGKK